MQQTHGPLGGPGDSCLYYNWFLYIVGNLVALGNPLTDVGPESNNFVAEILDLLVSVWSLSLTGVFIAIVGGLRHMARMTDRINGMDRRLASAMRSARDQAIANSALVKALHVELEALTNHEPGKRGDAGHARLSFEDFRSVCQRIDPNGIGADEAALKRDFDAADAHGKGALGRKELLHYLRRHVGLAEREPPLSPTNADVLAAVQAMAAEAAAFRVAVTSQLHALEEKVSAVDTLQRAGQPVSQSVWLQREVQRVEVERV